jgi:uncharacterized protein (DUF1501 family)
MAEPVLVVIFLRGGADTLQLVAPASDADYRAARPDFLRTAREGDNAGRALANPIADVDFRLHPSAGPLADLFDAGDLSVIHATGLAEATRSHFDAEARIERAGGGDGGASGWLGRWVAAMRPEGMLPALAVGTGMPDALRGARAAVAPTLEDLPIAAGHWLAPALRARLAQGFGAHGPLSATLGELNALSEVLTARLWAAELDGFRPYAPSVDYPASPLSQPLMTVAQAIKEDLGLRIATADYGGWDTHVRQADEFGGLVSGLSQALLAFWRDLGPRQQDVSVVVMSEFGRRLLANASQGTDHGRAGAMFVLGPQAKGGRMLGRWPGLSNDALEEGADLAVTTDYRAVLAELLAGHMRTPDLSAVFPGFTPEPVGLWS